MSASKKHVAVVEAGPHLGADGKPIVCVTVANSRPFALACITLLRRRDGRDHSWKLRQNAFWVPEDIIGQARAMVEEGRQ